MTVKKTSRLPAGWVNTARGELLNFDDLVMKAQRPMRKAEDKKNTVVRRVPKPAINVRGFSPVPGQAPNRVAVQAAPKQEIPAEHKVEKTIAEATSVRIDKPRYHKKRPQDPKAAANETLNEVLKALETDKQPAGEAPEDWSKS